MGKNHALVVLNKPQEKQKESKESHLVVFNAQENQKKSKPKTKWTPTYKEVQGRAKKKLESASATARSVVAGAMQANLLWSNELVLLFSVFLLLTFVFAALIAFMYSRDNFKSDFFQEGFLFFTTRIFFMYAVILFVGFTVIAILKNQWGNGSGTFSFTLLLLVVLVWSIMIYVELPLTCSFLLMEKGCAFEQNRSAIEEMQSNIYEIGIKAAVNLGLDIVPILSSGLLKTSASVFLAVFWSKWTTGQFCPSMFTNNGRCTSAEKERKDKYLYSFMKDAIFRLENGSRPVEDDEEVPKQPTQTTLGSAFTLISSCSGLVRTVALLSGLLPSAAFYTHVLDTNLFQEHFRYDDEQIDKVRQLLQKEGIFCTHQDAINYFVFGNTKRVKEGWEKTLKLLQMAPEKKTELKNLLLKKNIKEADALINGEKIFLEKETKHKTKLDWPTYKFVKDNSEVLKMVFKVIPEWGEEEVTLNDEDLNRFLGLKTQTFPKDGNVQQNIRRLTKSFEAQENKGSSTACSSAKSRPFHNILTPFSSDGCFTASGYPRTCLF